MQEAVIVSGARTPIGRFGGAFKDVSASELGSLAIKAALEQANIRPDQVDEVVLGNALQAAEAGYAARLASLGAGIPDEESDVERNEAGFQLGKGGQGICSPVSPGPEKITTKLFSNLERTGIYHCKTSLFIIKTRGSSAGREGSGLLDLSYNVREWPRS